MNKAYSLLNIKSYDVEQRIIKGIATTPSPDRVDDIVEPQGAEFALPIPFLWQHAHSLPIGQVTEANVSEEGIEVTVQIANIEEEGDLKRRIDEAWQSIKSGLVRGLSIGFRGLEVEEIPRSWGLRFKKWEWFELSAVTIAANAEASITEIKSMAESFDAERKSALGNPKHEKPKEQAATPVGDTTKKHPIVQLSKPPKAGVKL